jgi:molecular chaperone GrpE
MKKTIDKKTNQEVEVLKNQLARALADYDNLRKRVEREKAVFEKTANVNLAIKLLPVLDILRTAQKHLNDPGIGLTIKEFEEALGSEEIEEIPAHAGEEFNPELHEAVEVVEDGKDKAKIIEVVRPGWKFSQGPVVRHVQVKVSKKGINK